MRNTVQAHRTRRGWSQHDLARRAGLSRAAISAIETGRVVPATSAALALAHAMDVTVEALFSLEDDPSDGRWAWPAPNLPWRVWRTTVGGRKWIYPCEPSPLGAAPHDAVASDEGGRLILESSRPADPPSALVLAGCDPAMGLLGAALREDAGARMLAFTRSSGKALELLGRGVVHVAGVHLSTGHRRAGNRGVVRATLGRGYRLLHLASWDEGLVLARNISVRSLRAERLAKLRWVGRDEGSGARRCQDELLKGHRPAGPEHIAADHREVAQAVRAGWAEAGICVRLAAEEAGLSFVSIRTEAYDLCYRADLEEDPQLGRLLHVVRSASFRRLLGELPGYDTRRTGEVDTVA